jgi:hypothetical protein
VHAPGDADHRRLGVPAFEEPSHEHEERVRTRSIARRGLGSPQEDASLAIHERGAHLRATEVDR